MPFDPYTIHCPVHEGEATVKDDGQCPICDADLSALLAWRLHAQELYEKGRAAAEAGQGNLAVALLEEALRYVDDSQELSEARQLLEELSSQPVKAVRTIAWSWLAPLLAVLLIVGGGAGYFWGKGRRPEPESVQVTRPVTVVITATPEEQLAQVAPTKVPTLAPTVAPTLVAPTEQPTPVPSPTAVPCPGLLAQARTALDADATLQGADLRVAVEGCRVTLKGSVATNYLRDRAEDVVVAVQPQAEVDVGDMQISGQYVVRSGDTLWDIAEALYGEAGAYRWNDIYAANPGINVRALPVGLRLELPE